MYVGFSFFWPGRVKQLDTVSGNGIMHCICSEANNCRTFNRKANNMGTTVKQVNASIVRAGMSGIELFKGDGYFYLAVAQNVHWRIN